MAQFRIEFQPSNKSAATDGVASFLEISRQLGIGIAGICGGRGTCHACRIRIISGQVTPPSAFETESLTAEELKTGWRLACQSRPLSDCRVQVPAEAMTSTQRMQLEAESIDVRPDPVISAYQAELTPPTLIDPESDATRLLAALEKQGLSGLHFDIQALRRLPSVLRDHGWKCQVLVRGGETVGIRPDGCNCLGLAVDMGTTKIAGYLVDLLSGKVLTKTAIINPQAGFGEDVISRIDAAVKSTEDANALARLAIGAVNDIAAALCRNASALPEDIIDCVIVANTAIHHLLLKLPVRQLATAPYVPVIRQELDLKARDLGLDIAESAYVHIPANIAGFVGADHTSALLASNAPSLKGPALVVDIGTNTEISLVLGGKATCVSCASGPAFEGGHIEHGMRASTGAIERLSIDAEGISYQTIDNASPVGLCGSGIIDAIAAMYSDGAVDAGGRMQAGHRFVEDGKNGREFVVVPGGKGAKRIVITQADVREIQLAKAAIRAGIQVLLHSTGLTGKDLQQVILAGAFGSYISIESSIIIGLLPPLPLGRSTQVGNAAGAGAILALVSKEKRRAASGIAASAKYIEMAAVPSFNDLFVKASYLGKYSLDAVKGVHS